MLQPARTSSVEDVVASREHMFPQQATSQMMDDDSSVSIASRSVASRGLHSIGRPHTDCLDAVISDGIATGANPFKSNSAHPISMATFVGSYCFQEDDESEARILASREAGFHMRRAIEEKNLKEALRHATSLLWEIRVPLQSTTQYFRLYCSVTLELMKLLSYFEHPSFPYRSKLVELYEIVQHAGNAVPRVYLCILVARLLLGSGVAPSSLVLKDINEVVRGVQHPLRGLYARYFLTNVLSERLNMITKPSTSPEAQPESTEEPSVAEGSKIDNSCHPPPPPPPPPEPSDVTPNQPAEAQPDVVAERPSQLPSPDMESRDGTDDETPHGSTANDLEAEPSSNTVATLETPSLVRDCAVETAVEFYLLNIQEQNKLLTRLAYAQGGGTVGRAARASHTFMLKATIARLAELKDLDQGTFCDVVIPRLLTFILSLKDPQSKSSLFESMFQLFPPQFMLLTLGQIVQALFSSHVPDISELFGLLSERFRPPARASLGVRRQRVSVDCPLSIIDGFVDQVRSQVAESLEQLAAYSGEVHAAEVPHSIPVPLPVGHWTTLVRTMELILPLSLQHGREELLEPLTVLLYNFQGDLTKLISSDIPPEHMEIIDAARRCPNQAELTEILGSALTTIVEYLGLIPSSLETIQGFFEFTPDSERHTLAAALLRGLLVAKTEALKDPQQLAAGLGLAGPYICDQEQVDCLAKLSHRLKSDDLDLTFTLLTLLRAAGDAIDKDLSVAPLLTAIAHETLVLARTLGTLEAQKESSTQFRAKDLMQFAHGCCSELTELAPPLAFFACLEAAVACDALDGVHLEVANESGGYETATYEFLALAMGHYESSFANSKDEFSGLMKLISIVDRYIRFLSPENRDGFVTRLCNYASKLLRKHDRCRAILKCSFLFWNSPTRDPDRLTQCVQKALQLAQLLASTTAAHQPLVAEVIGVIEFYNSEGIETVPAQVLAQVHAQHKKMDGLEGGHPVHFSQTNQSLPSHLLSTINV
eukprot:Blabericola_migrator_1__7827@NODE_3_length_32604_cov_133_371700_g2_i0_p5_GENE_NODE_3_length_32604_cov_133_371700_g2_i0NODE_3_length_32604_cov_133_371700_g2_i0_p5_ORF_typecomplete_len995_score139_78Vps35/PF03635_17/1_5e100GET2/PF08690_10/6_5Mito_fiss_reg/PF05308_11/10_NODE_3_length_32604_cov_133_371700_g2_i016814665